jgi:hypothetical protein
MIEVNINYLAILVSAFIMFGLGALWYSPLLFARPWLASLGKTEEQLREDAQKRSMPLTFGLSFFAYLVMAFVMSHVIDYAAAKTISDGLRTGFWLWLGLVATTTLVLSLFESRSMRLYIIDMGYHLIGMLIMGGILAVWV